MMAAKMHENKRLTEKLPAGNFLNLALFVSRYSTDHGHFKGKQDG